MADASEYPVHQRDEAEPLAETPAASPDARTVCAGPEEARLELRSVGYCAYCDALVERQVGGGCAEGHPPEAIAGRILLLDDEPIPQLSRFNWAAFFLPPVWGPAHGQWAGAFFLPIWLFADSAIVAAVRQGGWMWIAAIVVFSGTIGFGYFFARRANGVAYRQVMDNVTLAEFDRRQRRWAWFCVPIGSALIAMGLYYDLVLAPVLKR